MKKTTVCVLFGGVSSEHAISLISAGSVIRNLDAEKYNIVMLGITMDGRWLLHEGSVDALADGSWEANGVSAFLSPSRAHKGIVCLRETGVEILPVDVVFPVLHGKNGEDGTVQGLLELAGIPYVGCGVLGSAVCMDKIVANQLMDAADIARCAWDYMENRGGEGIETREPQLAAKLGYPMFVKPANAGSSVGISKAHNREELFAAVQLAFENDSRILFERAVVGQEVECAVWGNATVNGTLPGEVLAGDEFYTYDDKYVNGVSRTAIPANLSSEKLAEVRDVAVKAYKALCCKGLSRVDFFVERGTGKVLLNEINTLPGFTDISMYPKLMIHEGFTYSSLLDTLLALAMEADDAK